MIWKPFDSTAQNQLDPVPIIHNAQIVDWELDALSDICQLVLSPTYDRYYGGFRV